MIVASDIQLWSPCIFVRSLHSCFKKKEAMRMCLCTFQVKRFWRGWVKESNMRIPGTQMTSIFEGQTPQSKAFSNQNKGHLGSRWFPPQSSVQVPPRRLQEKPPNTLSMPYAILSCGISPYMYKLMYRNNKMQPPCMQDLGYRMDMAGMQLNFYYAVLQVTSIQPMWKDMCTSHRKICFSSNLTSTDSFWSAFCWITLLGTN